MEYVRLHLLDLTKYIGRQVFVTFLAKEAEVRKQKDNVTDYLYVRMADLDKEYDLRMFGVKDVHKEQMKAGRVYNGIVQVEPYNKAPQGFSLLLVRFEGSNLLPLNFVKWQDNMEESLEVINKALVEIKDSIYYPLVNNMIHKTWDLFTVWTAGAKKHHAQLGGLMVHTAEVVQASSLLAGMYIRLYGEKFMNKPLLISGALLHDIGKLEEIMVDMTTGAATYTAFSSLGTHITFGLSLLSEEALKLGFAQRAQGKSEGVLEKEIEALELLKHMIASHHGKLEWGSPIEPHTPEAELLHFADLISARMALDNTILNNAEIGSSSTEWVGGAPKTIYREKSKTD